MKTKKILIICVLAFCVQFLRAQDGGYYLPYEMPGHTAVKYNTFLMNPAFPIFNLNESQITFYHRKQWMGLDKSNFSTFGLSYGKKWNDNNMAHGMVFQRKAAILTNTGLLGNYVHQVEISDDNFLRLGINAVFARSGIDKGKVISNAVDPLIENSKPTTIINIQPGFDINFNQIHFGVTAENLLDYAFSQKEMAVPFREKSLTTHLMYQKEFDTPNGLLEDATLYLLVKGKKTVDNFQLGGHAMLDTKIGWAYAGYDQKYGAFGGLGFNIASHLSIGCGYEQSLASYVAESGGIYDVLVSYQFGGKHHQLYRQAIEKRKQKERERERRLAEEARKREQEQKKPEVVTPPEPKVVTPTVTVSETPTTATETTQPAPQKPQPQRQIRVEEVKVDNLAEGYYVVIGVFRNPRGAYELQKMVRNLGVNVSSFVNPLRENMTYVYVNQAYQTREDASEVLLGLLKRPEFANSNIWILKTLRQ